MVFAVTALDEVLAVRSYRRSLDGEDVSLPAGYLDAGEDPLAGARRELLEETGHEAPTWSSLGSYVMDGNYGSGRAHIFLAEGAGEVRAPDAGDLEELTLLRFPLAEVLAGPTEPEARRESQRCLSCGNCFECDNCFAACPEDAIFKLGPGRRYEIKYALCTGCAVCVEQCPCHAMEMIPEPT